MNAMYAMDAMYATSMMHLFINESPVRKQWDSSCLKIVSNIHIYSSIWMKWLD
jgi:hypothetical protein